MICIIAQSNVQIWEFVVSYHDDLLGFNHTRGFTRVPDVHGELDIASGDVVHMVLLEVMQLALKFVAGSVPSKDHISVVAIDAKKGSHAEVVFR